MKKKVSSSPMMCKWWDFCLLFELKVFIEKKMKNENFTRIIIVICFDRIEITLKWILVKNERVLD